MIPKLTFVTFGLNQQCQKTRAEDVPFTREKWGVHGVLDLMYWIFQLHTYLYTIHSAVLYPFFSFTILMRLEREKERLFGMDVLVVCVCVKKTFILFMYMPYMCPLYLHTVKGGLATETSQKLDSPRVCNHSPFGS